MHGLIRCDPTSVVCPACVPFMRGCLLCGRTERVPLWLAVAYAITPGVWPVVVPRARGRTCTARLHDGYCRGRSAPAHGSSDQLWAPAEPTKDWTCPSLPHCPAADPQP